MKNYALRWEIEMSQAYQEYLLNLYFQGYIDEIWNHVMYSNHEATKVFVKEVNDVQFKFIVSHMDIKY